MNKWPGALFLFFLHPASAPNKTLISNTDMLGSKFSNFHERSFFHAQIFTRDHFFMLSLSTHVSGFTLHTVIWFTLSKHMLGSKFSNFHRSSFFSYLHSPLMFQDSLSTHVSGFTLHTVIWFPLSKRMLGSQFSNFQRRSFSHAYTLNTYFMVHSPYSYLVYTLQHMLGSTFLDFHRISFFSYLHSPLMFQSSLSMQLFLHSPSRCYIISSCA